MSRLVLIFVVTFGVLLALGVHAWGIMSLAAAGLLLFGALSGGWSRKSPRSLFTTLAAIILGPVLLCCLLKAWFGSLLGPLNSATQMILALVVIGASAASFVYVRSRLRQRAGAGQRQLHTNERQPIFPMYIDEGVD